ncbi:hypothetical protein D3C86_2110120 [compost metagenome]
MQQLENVESAQLVKNGSVVLTSEGNFYISISAGELNVDGQKFFAVSQASPIGKSLIGKAIGESFKFNGKEYLVQDIL